MVSLGQVHFYLAVVALVSGGVVVALKKGDGIHRLVGFVYATSMHGLHGSALMIYNLTGSFGPFHILAIFSLATLLLGLLPVLLRRPKDTWIERHAVLMSWSYVGLLAAAAAETLTRVPTAPFWWAVVAASLLVIAIGARIINRTVPRILSEEFPRGGATRVERSS